jgi:hypothetical protein
MDAPVLILAEYSLFDAETGRNRNADAAQGGYFFAPNKSFLSKSARSGLRAIYSGQMAQ